MKWVDLRAHWQNDAHFAAWLPAPLARRLHNVLFLAGCALVAAVLGWVLHVEVNPLGCVLAAAALALLARRPARPLVRPARRREAEHA